MAMQNLDIKNLELFGWTLPKNACWWYILNSSISKGWNNVDVKKAEESLKDNIQHCYERLFQAEFEDLDDSIHYTVFFNNQKKLYDLELTNSNSGEILPEQKKEFFKSEMFKKTATRANELLLRAKKLVENVVIKHVEDGELLAIDEIKLEAIIDMLNDQQLMKNFKYAKYSK